MEKPEVIPFLNYTENPVCSEAISSRESNNNTLDSIFISVVVSLPFCPPPNPPVTIAPVMQAG